MNENKYMATVRSYLSAITGLVSVLSVFALAAQLVQDEDRGEVLKPYAIASVTGGMLFNIFSLTRELGVKRIFLSKEAMQDYYRTKYRQRYVNKGKDDRFCPIVGWSTCCLLILGLPFSAIFGEFGFFIGLSVFAAAVTLAQSVLCVDKIRDNCLVPAQQKTKPHDTQLDQGGAVTTFLERENWTLFVTELQFALIGLAILDSVSSDNVMVPMAFLAFMLAKQVVDVCAFLPESMEINKILKPDYEKANTIFALNKVTKALHFVPEAFLLAGFLMILPRTHTAVEQAGHTFIGLGCLVTAAIGIAKFYLNDYMVEAKKNNGTQTLLLGASAKPSKAYGTNAGAPKIPTASQSIELPKVEQSEVEQSEEAGKAPHV